MYDEVAAGGNSNRGQQSIDLEKPALVVKDVLMGTVLI